MFYALLCFSVAAISAFLVFHCKYEDGLVGRIALAILFFGNAIVFGEWFNGVEYSVNPTTLTIQLGISLFLIRHVYRFLKWSKSGDNDWRGHEKTLDTADVVCPLLRPRSKESKRKNSNNAGRKAIKRV